MNSNHWNHEEVLKHPPEPYWSALWTGHCNNPAHLTFLLHCIFVLEWQITKPGKAKDNSDSTKKGQHGLVRTKMGQFQKKKQTLTPLLFHCFTFFVKSLASISLPLHTLQVDPWWLWVMLWSVCTKINNHVFCFGCVKH